jgi:predicted MPP superfamily phosphohydrolase
MNRRRWLIGAGIAGIGAVAYSTLFEPEWFDVTHATVLLPGLKEGAKIRLLHIADLHASMWVPMFLLERAIDLCIATGPDMICLTGDFVTSQSDYDRARYVRTLQRLAGFAPSFAVLGNHDGGHWSQSRSGLRNTDTVQSLLAESGIHLLHNESRLISVAGADLRLVGLGDLWARQIDAPRAFREVAMREPVVLMAHNPDTKDLVTRFPWELMLSGHTHGGQVVLPWWGPGFAPVNDKRYIAGLKPWHTRQIHVTRGVGSIDGVRFNCRPEISVLELTG